MPGMVEGADPTLKDTYVLFGAHLDRRQSYARDVQRGYEGA